MKVRIVNIFSVLIMLAVFLFSNFSSYLIASFDNIKKEVISHGTSIKTFTKKEVSFDPFEEREEEEDNVNETCFHLGYFTELFFAYHSFLSQCRSISNTSFRNSPSVFHASLLPIYLSDSALLI